MAEQALLPLQERAPETQEQAMRAAFHSLPSRIQQKGMAYLMHHDEATRHCLELAARARLRKAGRA